MKYKILIVFTFLSFGQCFGGIIQDIFRRPPIEILNSIISDYDWDGENSKKWDTEIKESFPELASRINPKDLAKFFQLIMDLVEKKDSQWKSELSESGEIIMIKKDEQPDFLFWPNENKSSQITTKSEFVQFLDHLSMCSCDKAPTEQRMYFIFSLLNDVAKKYSDVGTKLVITSYGSFKLLQEFIAVLGLIALGYSNFELNLIDKAYDEANLASWMSISKISELEEPFKKLVNFYVDNFKKPTSPNFNLNMKLKFYSTASEYIGDIEAVQAEKSNIIFAIDWDDDVLIEENESVDKSAKVKVRAFKNNESEEDRQKYSGVYSVNIPLTGPLTFWNEHGDKEAYPSVSLLFSNYLQCQNKFEHLIGTEQFRENILNCLKQNPVQSVEFSVSLHDTTWGFRDIKALTEKAGIDNRSRLIIFQIGNGIIYREILDISDDGMFGKRKEIPLQEIIEARVTE